MLGIHAAQRIIEQISIFVYRPFSILHKVSSIVHESISIVHKLSSIMHKTDSNVYTPGQISNSDTFLGCQASTPTQYFIE